MFKDTKAFHGFSVKDTAAAKAFYQDVLGLEVEDGSMGLTLKLAGSVPTFIYQKDDHIPATYTILNFPVDNIDETIDALTAKGVTFEHYPEMTDEKGVMRGLSQNMGPDIAWFKDPSGNILSILQDK